MGYFLTYVPENRRCNLHVWLINVKKCYKLCLIRNVGACWNPAAKVIMVTDIAKFQHVEVLLNKLIFLDIYEILFL